MIDFVIRALQALWVALVVWALAVLVDNGLRRMR